MGVVLGIALGLFLILGSMALLFAVCQPCSLSRREAADCCGGECPSLLSVKAFQEGITVYTNIQSFPSLFEMGPPSQEVKRISFFSLLKKRSSRYETVARYILYNAYLI